MAHLPAPFPHWLLSLDSGSNALAAAVVHHVAKGRSRHRSIRFRKCCVRRRAWVPQARILDLRVYLARLEPAAEFDADDSRQHHDNGSTVMWLGILSRAWPYLAGAIALIGLAIYLNQTGYRSGYAASEAHWQPLFEAAARERDEANARASVLEARSTALSAESEKQHAESMAALQARASDAERTNRNLVRQFAARSRCGAVPEASGTPTVPDAGSASDEHL